MNWISTVAEVITALATSAAAAAVIYPYWRNRLQPEIAYESDVNLRDRVLPNSPFGVKLEQPYLKRFVLTIKNPRLAPLTIHEIYFHRKKFDTRQRYYIPIDVKQIAPGDTRFFYIRMGEIPHLSTVYLVIEGPSVHVLVKDLGPRLGRIDWTLIEEDPRTVLVGNTVLLRNDDDSNPPDAQPPLK